MSTFQSKTLSNGKIIPMTKAKSDLTIAKRLPGQKYSLAVDNVIRFTVEAKAGTPNGGYIGAARGLTYVGTWTFGQLPVSLDMRDERIPGNHKVVTLTGVFQQGSNYLLVTWLPTNKVPTAQMPKFTNNFKINGGPFVYGLTVNSAVPAVSGPQIGVYWMSANYKAPHLDQFIGQVCTLEFI